MTTIEINRGPDFVTITVSDDTRTEATTTVQVPLDTTIGFPPMTVKQEIT